MNDNDKKLLKLIAASIATGAGGHALFRSILAPPKKIFNEKKDLYTPGGSPVYVDMSPDEAARFEELTGVKSANVKVAELKQAGDDYSWLTKILAAGGGAYAGWSILDKVLDNIRKRKLDGELAQAQGDLGALYATKPIKGMKALPENKKIAALQEFMDGSYEFWKAAHYAPSFELALKEAGLGPAISAAKVEIGDKDDASEEDFAKAGIKDPNLKALISKAHKMRRAKKEKKDDKKSDKTAGIIDSIGSVAATPVTAPIKSMAGYGLKSIAPVLAAIALISAYGAYQNNKGVAGDRRDLKAVRNEARQSEDRPYIELKPRVVSPE